MVSNREARAMRYENKYHYKYHSFESWPLPSKKPSEPIQLKKENVPIFVLSVINGLILTTVTVLYWNIEPWAAAIVWLILFMPIIFLCAIVNIFIFWIFGVFQ